tara:strand:- start:509 stop:1240 length:732 start_codon:yes stop_codon:yes gene_type:complete
MADSKSKFLELSKKFKILKKLYFFYNIYIRNFKFLKNGTQFGEDKYIIELFDENFKGKFLDIGCYHPTRHNNTYSMYKSGWSGMNIDLNPLTIELFDFMRPRDININSGVSDTEIEKKLYFIDELNTQNTLDKNQLNFLKNHHNIKESEIFEKKIKTRNLNNILDDHKFYNIDFMNLDIEGHELKVLGTLDFDKINIRYLCIEMIEHNKESVMNNEKIKNLLSQNNFKLIKNFDFNFIYKKEN